MALSLFIAKRLTLRSTSGGVQTGIAIAVTGVALSVLVMLISIAVMIGFKDEIRQKIMGFDSQLSVAVHPSDNTDGEKLLDMAEISDALAVLPSTAKTALTIRQPVILKTPTEFTGAVVKGMSRDYDWDFVKENLVEGVIPDYEADSTLYHIIISRNLARNLDAKLGDKIDAFFLGNDTYRTRRLKIAGVYDTHFGEYDDMYIFSTLPMLSALAGIDGDKGTQFEIAGLGSDDEIARCGRDLSVALTEKLYRGQINTLYTVTDVHTSAALYFNWLALLDTNVVVILTLMALLTCLTLVSSLYMLILRRVNMIGILKSLGATDALIRRTFIYLTLRILVIGLLIGNALGLGVIILQNTARIVPLNPEAYYLDHVPMLMSWKAWLLLNVAIVAVAALVLILPSAIITTIPPSKVINYE